VSDAWTNALDVAVAECQRGIGSAVLGGLTVLDFQSATGNRQSSMLESERITEQIVGTRMDEHLILAVLEVARQVALLTERLSELPITDEGASGQPAT
jgi:hypothetical protein